MSDSTTEKILYFDSGYRPVTNPEKAKIVLNYYVQDINSTSPELTDKISELKHTAGAEIKGVLYADNTFAWSTIVQNHSQITRAENRLQKDDVGHASIWFYKDDPPKIFISAEGEDRTHLIANTFLKHLGNHEGWITLHTRISNVKQHDYEYQQLFKGRIFDYLKTKKP